jgi:hypothetical protein
MSFILSCLKKVESEIPDVEKTVEDMIEKKIAPMVEKMILKYIEERFPTTEKIRIELKEDASV